MNYKNETFFIANFSIRELRQTRVFSSKQECEEFIIKQICDSIIKEINTRDQIIILFDRYFKLHHCECCKVDRYIFDKLPSTINEAIEISKCYGPYSNYQGDPFLYNIYEHKPE